MSALPPSYYRILEEKGGAWMSAHVGGPGKDGDPALYKELKTIFKEWDAEWKRKGLKPKRQKRNG